ncbi:MAG: biopolymer transporter ExbD [Deltaproteobacteria bacterium]|nr:biopolymer transporter ExbD [Deltaproteobacteria bacterium]
MKFQRSKHEEPTLGIAPLIDIVFLLLIFFMVTSHFDVASGVRIKLPRISRVIYNETGDTVTVVIDQTGRAYLEGKMLDLKILGERLKDLVAEKNTVRLILQADKDVKHGVVVEAMDVAKTAGVKSIVISAQWKPQKPL